MNQVVAILLAIGVITAATPSPRWVPILFGVLALLGCIVPGFLR